MTRPYSVHDVKDDLKKALFESGDEARVSYLYFVGMLLDLKLLDGDAYMNFIRAARGI